MKTPKELPKTPNQVESGRVYEFGPFRLDEAKRRLWRNGELVALTPKAVDTLLVLVKRAGSIVEKDELMQLVWPDSFVVDDNLIQNVSALRKALGDSSEIPEYIATLPRRGYRFVARVKSAQDGDGGDLVREHVSSEPAGGTPRGDVGREMERPSGAVAPPVPQRSAWRELFSARTSGERLWMGTSVLLLAVLLATLGFAVSSGRRLPTSAGPVRFTVYPPENMSLASSGVLSPDGRRMVFVAQHPSGKTLLTIRALGSLETQTLAGTDGASNPFWSPDNQWIGFFARGKLKKVGLSGEAPRGLADVERQSAVGTWSPEGTIVFGPIAGEGLYRTGADGGVPSPMTKVDLAAGETRHQSPWFLPDGRHFLYVSISNRPEQFGGVYIGSVDSGETTRLLDLSHSSPAYAPSGHLLSLRDDVLMAQAFDAKLLRLSGEAVPLVEGVASFSVADNGTLAYTSATGTLLVWFDRAGRQLEVVPHSDGLGNPALSRDESQVVANRRFWGKEGQTIWFVDTERNVATRFTARAAGGAQPVWSPDGKHFVFTSGGNLYRAQADGSTPPELLLRTPASKFPKDWSLDGSYIVYSTVDPKTKWDLWLLPTSGDRKPVPYLQTTFNETDGHISPDGRWMAYESNESGTGEIYLQSFPVPGSKWRVSVNGGSQPKWRRDGRELFYLAPDRKLMAVAVRMDDGLELGVPKVLFQTAAPAVGRNSYVVSSDGERFLVETRLDPSGSAMPIIIVLNWTALLNR